MNIPDVKEILKLIAADNCTKAQTDDFNNWLASASKEDYLEVLNAWEKIADSQPDKHPANPILIAQIETSLDYLDTPVAPLYQQKNFFSNARILSLGMAASFLLLLSVGLFFYYNPEQSVKNSLAKDILPGGNRAILTLSDGSKINLNNLKKGEAVMQAGIKIVKSNDGQLEYTVLDQTAVPDKTLSNTIQTPIGGQYRINLPDGSIVWLNASSSLRYPLSFTHAERVVELTGEGYFEIAKDKKRPFRVKTEKQIVEVLGTHFNINSYLEEETTKTTLLEGSVSIQSNVSKKTMLLKPGEQAQVNDHDMLIKDVDVNDAAAWKDGFFVFNAENIPSVMRKIARWYDVEITYEGKISESDLAGSVSRSSNVSEVLKTLELTGLVRFKVEGRKITVIAQQ